MIVNNKLFFNTRHMSSYARTQTLSNMHTNVTVTPNKWSHVFYRMVPNMLFTSANVINTVFLHGIATLTNNKLKQLNRLEDYYSLSNDLHSSNINS